MAGLPEGFAMLPEGQEPIYSGVTIGAGATVNVVSNPQYPRLKAPAPQPPQSAPRPSTAASPTSPTEPMETDGEQRDETMGTGAQSISSGSTTSIATTIVMDIKSLMWDSIVSGQCAPVVLQQLKRQSSRHATVSMCTFCTFTIDGMHQQTMTTTAAISQYTCLPGKRQSTQYWRTVTIRPMHIAQSTSAERKMSQSSSIQSSMDRIQLMNLNLQALMGRPIG
eukprot:3837804-Amphidinium_carterae.1